jgi:hypothetical protein
MNQNSPRICEMKTIKCCGLIVVWLCLGQLGAQTNYQVQMAYYFAGNQAIPAAFYERVRDNNFNYVLAEYCIDGNDWADGKYMASNGTGQRERLRLEFIAANKYGLKLIPLFQTSNAHSGHWAAAKNDSIQWQQLPAGLYSTEPTYKVVPTFAPDHQNVWGFDSTFKELLKVIYGAFDSAKDSLSYKTLDYIHFGADEPAVPCTGGVTARVVMAGLCSNDIEWLARNKYNNSDPNSAQRRILALLGSNIKRKVQMIKKVGDSYGQKTIKALYYGDALDPNQDGGDNANLHTFTNLISPSPSQSGITKIKTYSLADSVKAMKDSLVVVQWYYYKDYNEKDYDTDSTFRYFANKGLTFLHGNALADEGGTIANDRWYQLDEQMYVGSRPKYAKNVSGFVSFHWTTKPYNPNEKMYKTMEFLWHTMWVNVATLE